MIYWIASVVTLIYGSVLLFFVLMWYLRKYPVAYSEGHTDVFASIIIPVRNESKHIERLIKSIYNSTADNFEIIVVDDHSEDETKDLIRTLQSEYSGLNLAELSDDKSGKKAAITFGVSLAQGDLIVCTDGDGEVAAGWLDTHKRACTSGVKLAFGPVKLFNTNKSRWIDMLNLELAALVGVGAATLKMGSPTMINGCNYSFSKSVFEEVKGFEGNEHVASGDDEFLLRKIYQLYPYLVHFLKSQDALVISEPPEDWNTFYHQRRRWASKWKFHQDVFSKVTPVFVFCVYGIWSWLALDSCLTGNPLGLYIFAAKACSDYVFIHAVSQVQNRRVSVFSFLLLQIIYPFYVVFFGVASNFGKYQWQGRTHKI